jgi:hypothetical protein
MNHSSVKHKTGMLNNIPAVIIWTTHLSNI